MKYVTTDGVYQFTLQPRGRGEEVYNKMLEAFRGGHTHAKPWRIRIMLYSEFIEKVRVYRDMWGNKWNEPTIEEYQSLIEPVYNYHPLQLNKEEIATLYCIGGLPLFDDLNLVAMDYQDYEDNYNEAKAAWDKAQREWEQALSKYCNKK